MTRSTASLLAVPVVGEWEHQVSMTLLFENYIPPLWWRDTGGERWFTDAPRPSHTRVSSLAGAPEETATTGRGPQSPY